MVAKDQIRQEFAQRLNRACDEAGVRAHGRAVDIQFELKRRGLTATTTAIGKWLNGDSMPESDKLRAMAAWLGVRAEWLEYGADPMLTGARLHVAEPGVKYKDATPLGVMEHRMPLISRVSAGNWCESPDEFAPGDAEEWLPRPDNAGPRSFALRVDGDSMTSPYPGQRSYPPGMIIFVDPDRTITNGCRVVARLPDGEHTFKSYTEDAGKKYLKPLNPQYPMIEITSETLICGVVIGAYLPE